MKIKSILLILFLFCLSTLTIYSQTIFVRMPSLADINEKNEMIMKELAKADCYDDRENYQIAHIFEVEYVGNINKADFTDKTFLRNINPMYFYKKGLFHKDKYIQTVSLICKNDTSYLSQYEDGQEIWCGDKNPELVARQTKIAKIILNPETAMVIEIYYKSNRFWAYLIVKYSGEVYVLTDVSTIVSIFPLNEFVAHHWEELIGQSCTIPRKPYPKDSLAPESLDGTKK
ncbi:MAG: hypothetical protein WCR42_08990 [bacterium]